MSRLESLQIDQLADILVEEGRLNPRSVGVSRKLLGAVDAAMSRPHFFRRLTRRWFPAMHELPFDAAYYLAHGRYGDPASVAAQNAAWRANFVRTTRLFTDARLVVRGRFWLLPGAARTIYANVDGRSNAVALFINDDDPQRTTEGPRIIQEIVFELPLFGDGFEFKKIRLYNTSALLSLETNVIVCEQLLGPRQRCVSFSGIDWEKERFMFSTIGLKSHGFDIPTLFPPFADILDVVVSEGGPDTCRDFIGRADLTSLSDAAMNEYVRRATVLVDVPRLPQPVSVVEVSYKVFVGAETRTALVRRDSTFAAVLAAYPGDKCVVEKIWIGGATLNIGLLSFTVQNDQTSSTALLRLDQVLKDGVTRFCVTYRSM